MTTLLQSGLLAFVSEYKKKISTGEIILFWLPLAFTWLMMATEGPTLTAVIARLPDAKYNLAAFGIAISLALIIEAPIIMIMSASTALVQDAHSLKKLFRYTLFANLAITVVMIGLVSTPLFRFLTDRLMGIPAEIAVYAHGATALLLPWPAAIGFRRFYQGILIRNQLTRRVAYGTIIRLISVIFVILYLYFHKDIPGVYLGASALSIAVIAEALATRCMVPGKGRDYSRRSPQTRT